MATPPLIISNVLKGSNGIQRLSVSLNDKNEKLDDSITTTILSTDENAPEQEFIDGDTRAWLIVVGSWLNIFGTLGNIYAFGVYQFYYTHTYLSHQSPSSISWIGSVQLTLPFFFGVVSGKIFDKGYVRSVIVTGSTVFLFSLFMLSLAKEDKYYQVFLSQGLGMGLGAGLVFAPCTTAVGIHFRRRRSLAIGLSLTGASVGAVAFPIILNNLFPKIGFGSTVRVTGYISLGCLVVGNCFIWPRQIVTKGNIPTTNMLNFFRDPPYVLFLIGMIVAALAVYFPAFYIQLYSIDHNVDTTLSFYSLSILNGAGIIGRLVPNYLGDIYGVWNILVPITLITGVSIWAILGIHDPASLIIASILHGVSSSAWLALSLAGLASLTSSHEAGTRVGLALGIISLGLLASAPIQGALLGKDQADYVWIKPIAYSGSLMFAATIIFGIVRMLIAKQKGSQRV